MFHVSILSTLIIAPLFIAYNYTAILFLYRTAVIMLLQFLDFVSKNLELISIHDENVNNWMYFAS